MHPRELNTGRLCMQGRSNGAVASTSAAAGTGAAAAAAAQPQRLGKLGKNPAVPTDFLPDVDREREEERMREQLKREYELRQQACTSYFALCRERALRDAVCSISCCFFKPCQHVITHQCKHESFPETLPCGAQ